MDYSLSRLRMKFGERAFSHAGSATWNALPDHIRTVADPVKFRQEAQLSPRDRAMRRVVSIEILPIATQQCRNYLYDKS